MDPTETVRAITLTQPWASLIAAGAKTIETRSWPWLSLVGQPLLIHAASTYGGIKGIRDHQTGEPLPGTRRGYLRVCDSLADVLQAHDLDPETLPAGAIVATSLVVAMLQHGDAETERLVDRRMHQNPYERRLGGYGPGRWYWLLDQTRPLLEPIKVAGAQGVWSPGYAITRQAFTR